MIRHSVLDTELAEPAIGEVHLHFTADQPFRADRKDIPHDQHHRSSAPDDLPEPRRQDETRRTADLGHSSDGPSWIDLAEIRVNITESRFAACRNRLLQQNRRIASFRFGPEFGSYRSHSGHRSSRYEYAPTACDFALDRLSARLTKFSGRRLALMAILAFSPESVDNIKIQFGSVPCGSAFRFPVLCLSLSYQSGS